MTRERVPVGGWVVAVLALLATAGAGADWLVTRGHSRVQTRGPWQVKGAQVVFTDTDGRLVSLPVALFDLDASRKATETAASVTPTPSPVPPTRAPVAVITDADVGHVRGEAATSSAPETAADEGRVQPPVTLYSASWCGWCRKTKALLAELGVMYTDRDVDRDPRAKAELLRLTGGSFGVPVLDIGGTVIRGYAPERIRALLAPPSPTPAPPADAGSP